MNEIELYLSGKSITEVSEITGIPRSSVRNRLFKACCLRSRSDSIKLAAKHGKLGSGLRGKKRPERSKDWCDKISNAKKGKGVGFSKKPNGYIEITMGENKFRGQHVVIMEEIIGRRLYANECVHHKNGIRHDNRPENLQLMTRSEHLSHHAKENSHKRKRDNIGRYL